MRDRRRLRLLFVGLMLGLLLSELDQNVFATALPTIVGELDGVGQMLWVTTAYVLAATVTMPVYGKLGDLIGRRPVFLVGLSVFVAGSVVGGLAPDMGWLIAARVVQGLGGGGLLVLVQAIVADVVPARERAPYLSAVDAVFALSAVVGPVLGGWFAEGAGWRWAFWVNVPLGALAIVAAATLLPPPRRQARGVQLDVAGIACLSVAVSALVLLASEGGTRYAWRSPLVLGVAAVAVLASVGFVLAERAAAEPVIPLSLLRNRDVAVATGSALVMSAAMFGAIGYLPTYLQMVQGLTPTRAGLWMLSLIAGLGLLTVGSAQVVRRTGRYVWLPVAGTLTVAVALGLLSTLEPATPLPLVAAYLFLLGAGIGCALEILVVLVQNAVPPDQLGTATATHSFFREIGVSLGSALVGAVFTSRLTVLLAGRSGGGVDLHRLTPAAARALPGPLRDAVVSSYNDALTPVFALLIPLLVLSAVALRFIRPVPLATTVPDRDSVRT